MEADAKWTCAITNGNFLLAQEYGGSMMAGRWEEWETKEHSLALNKPWSGPASFCLDMYHVTPIFTFVSIRNSTHTSVQMRLFSTPKVHGPKRICLKTYWKCGGPTFCELKSPFGHTYRALLPFTFQNWLTKQKEKTMKILVKCLLYSQLIHYSSKPECWLSRSG